jgi:hypothetical protein
VCASNQDCRCTNTIRQLTCEVTDSPEAARRRHTVRRVARCHLRGGGATLQSCAECACKHCHSTPPMAHQSRPRIRLLCFPAQHDALAGGCPCHLEGCSSCNEAQVRGVSVGWASVSWCGFRSSPEPRSCLGLSWPSQSLVAAPAALFFDFPRFPPQ